MRPVGGRGMRWSAVGGPGVDVQGRPGVVGWERADGKGGAGRPAPDPFMLPRQALRHEMHGLPAGHPADPGGPQGAGLRLPPALLCLHHL